MGLNEVVKQIEQFLRELKVDDEAAVEPPESGLPFMFSRAGRGTMTLTSQEAREYGQLLDGLYTSLPDSRRKAITTKTLGTWFQEAVFDAVAGGDSQRPEATRAAGQALRRKLHQPTNQYWVYLPLDGVKVPRRARKCGAAIVRAPRSRAVADARREGRTIIARGTSSPEVKAHAAGKLRDEMKSQFTDRAVAEIVVDSLDAESAERQARDVLREVADIVNFFAVILVPREITAFASADGPTGDREKPLLIGRGRNVRFPNSAPRRLIDLDALFSDDATRLGTRKVFRLLASAKRTSVEGRILSAISWIGYGNSRPRPVEAFVNYLISLEALLLGPQNDRDISYKLRLRCAHVIASSTAARRQVFNRLGTLYSIRSKVVHAGIQDVDDTDLSDARFFAQRAALEVLQSRRFAGVQDLEPRFLELALGRGV
jgi:hypothetical protein